MKSIIIQIEDCWHCPFSQSDAYSDSEKQILFCKKLKERELIYNKIEGDLGVPVYYPIPVDCPQQLDSKTTLTEDNIKDYGFEDITICDGLWHNFEVASNKFGISICTKTEYGFEKGSWYYGSDFIKIDTVEELKQLYKLVTKKALI